MKCIASLVMYEASWSHCVWFVSSLLSVCYMFVWFERDSTFIIWLLRISEKWLINNLLFNFRCDWCSANPVLYINNLINNPLIVKLIISCCIYMLKLLMHTSISSSEDYMVYIYSLWQLKLKLKFVVKINILWSIPAWHTLCLLQDGRCGWSAIWATEVDSLFWKCHFNHLFGCPLGVRSDSLRIW